MTQLDRIEKDLKEIKKTLIELSGVEVNKPEQKETIPEFTKYGGIRIPAVDAILDEWLQSGDSIKKSISKSIGRNICFDQKGLTNHQRVQIQANQQRMWAVDQKVDKLQLMHGLYYDTRYPKTDGSYPVQTFKNLTTEQRESGYWHPINKRIKGFIQDHTVVADSNNSATHSKHYESFVQSIPELILEKMEGDYRVQKLEKLSKVKKG